MSELWDMLLMGPRVRERQKRDPEHCWDLCFRGKVISKEVLTKRLWRKKHLISQLREGRPFGMRVALQDKLGPLTNAFICSEVRPLTSAFICSEVRPLTTNFICPFLFTVACFDYPVVIFAGSKAATGKGEEGPIGSPTVCSPQEAQE